MLALRRSSFNRRARVRPYVDPLTVGLWPLVAIRTTSLRQDSGALLHLSGLLPVRFTVTGSGADFEFVELVPLFIGTIPLGDGKKFAYPAARINWLWIIHAYIMTYSGTHIQPRKFGRIGKKPAALRFSVNSAL
jgi:hypothetical protein